MPSEYTNNFNQLQEAILDGKSVKIKYKNFKEQYSERIIKPFKFEMVERKANFYDRLCIKAYCNLRKEDRLFAVYRIQKLEIINENN